MPNATQQTCMIYKYMMVNLICKSTLTLLSSLPLYRRPLEPPIQGSLKLFLSSLCKIVYSSKTIPIQTQPDDPEVTS